MSIYQEQLSHLFHTFGEAGKMVLSTSSNNHVTSRMMSIIILDGCFYFQTDKTFRKYAQIIENPQVALCMDNIQIEGLCHEIGTPLAHPEFCKLYEKNFKSSYDRYTSLDNERLFKIIPTYIQKWIYEQGIPFVEIFDYKQKTYSKEPYFPD